MIKSWHRTFDIIGEYSVWAIENDKFSDLNLVVEVVHAYLIIKQCHSKSWLNLLSRWEDKKVDVLLKQ